MMPSFELLVEKFLQDDLTPAELSLFLHLVKEPSNLQILREILTEKLENREYTGLSDDANVDLMFSQMLARAQEEEADNKAPASPPKRLFPIWRAAAAAAVLFVVGVSYFLLLKRSSTPPIAQKPPAPALKTDVAPGGNKAMLTLSDGSTISLEDANNGTLAQQGNARVVKLSNGELAYQPSGRAAKEILYNTVSTPRGGQFRLTLPDGTQVWINASSSITYPTAFTGKDRKVEMKGEAYFEVAHHADQPFRVQVKGMEVYEIGTHFSINAYEDESEARTTLLEGAVRITKGASSLLLRPGQQASCGSADLVSLVKDADVEEAVAWKEGLFSFDGADLPSIMRQLVRWYDLEVHYEGEAPKRHFTGKVFRNLPLSETLKVLELSHVHFRIEGRRLTVTP
ncbi:MAG TPA: FecR domain-containing protein [Puia sp.]|nr:FecR domain-containing protein [Puia sp.]